MEDALELTFQGVFRFLPWCFSKFMPATILSARSTDVALAASALRRGEVVAMPTETVYGLAGIAFDERAVAAIFAAKERPTFDPLICHVPAVDNDWLSHLAAQGLVDVERLSLDAQHLIERVADSFWPGPLTLVLPRQAQVPDLVTSGLPTVGVRCPRHAAAQSLLNEVGLPLAAPSANRFGRISPTAASHVMAELGDRIPYILDGGDCQIGIESTVLLVEGTGNLVLLRPGAISAEQIAGTTGCQVTTMTAATPSLGTPVPAPGMLASHYAPRKPLTLFDKPLARHSEADLQAWHAALQGRRAGVLSLTLTGVSRLKALGVFALPLSNEGNAADAARQLFGHMRRLDECDDVDEIWAELHPDVRGLGHAINDRLRKASHR